MNYLIIFSPFLPLVTHTVHFWSAGITLGSSGFCSDLEVKLIATLSALLELAHPTDVILSAASSAGSVASRLYLQIVTAHQKEKTVCVCF